MKLQAEFLEKLVAPLLDQAAGRHDEDAVRIGAHDQLADVEPGHDRLACAGVIGQDEAQGLAREHGFIDSGDLVRQRLDIRGVDRHHRVEQKSEVDAFGFAGQLEGGAVAVK